MWYMFSWLFLFFTTYKILRCVKLGSVSLLSPNCCVSVIPVKGYSFTINLFQVNSFRYIFIIFFLFYIEEKCEGPILYSKIDSKDIQKSSYLLYFWYSVVSSIHENSKLIQSSAKLITIAAFSNLSEIDYTSHFSLYLIFEWKGTTREMEIYKLNL